MHQFFKFILEGNSTCFGQLLCPSTGVFYCMHSNSICYTGFADSLQAGSGWNPDPACKLSEKNVWHISLLCVQWKTPDDGQRNCLKHVEFPSKINLRNQCIWLVYYKKFVTMHSHMNVKFVWHTAPFRGIFSLQMSPPLYNRLTILNFKNILFYGLNKL